MSIFPNAQGIVINNSQFTDQQINQVSSGPTGIDILFEATIPEVAHDSSARDPPPSCFPGTREQHIEDIVQWAIPAMGSTPSSIFRMNGPAGVGKSAIAQTCVEKVKAEGKLGAAFFFSINGRNQHTHFFTTIAYQLTTVFPDYHDLVEKKVRRDRTLIDKAVASQFRELIVEPLRELERNGKGIGNRIPIFVDGLDECEDEGAQCTIIEAIATAAHNNATPLCWAFFSRPESHIEATFSRTDVSVLCHTVTILPNSSEAKREIELYLRAGFESILRRHNISLDCAWPSEKDIETLTNAANGLFVYAATTLRFIDRAGTHGPEGPLREVLAVISQSDTTTAPFAELDAFYTLIMRRIPAKMFLHIRLLLAILCHLNSSPSAVVMANILRLSKMEYQAVCNRLSAVLRVSDQNEILKLEDGIGANHPYYQHPKISLEDLQKLRSSVFSQCGGRMTFYHKSFRDFLIDPKRSDVFWFEPCAIYPLLFNHCYELRLDFEKCYLLCGSKLAPARHIPDSTFPLSSPGASELVNSVIKAKVHLLAANLCSDLADSPDLDFALIQKHGCADFRKSLFVWISLYPVEAHDAEAWGCLGRAKAVGKTHLFRLLPGEFQKFDVVGFKNMIGRRQQAGALRPYFPTLTSWLWSFSPRKTPVESGLYLVGHGPKSVFWYWEINFKDRYYQEFSTPDLTEGERIFREERFDLWFKEDHK